MIDCIDREYLVDHIHACMENDRLMLTATKEEMLQMIADVPSADAVEVVRCGECKHMTPDGRCMEFADDGIRPSVEDFCSYGERREEDEV